MFWFALSFLWAGMLTLIIQELVRQFIGEQRKDLYLGWTLALGALICTVTVIVVGAASDRSRWALGRRRPYLIAGSILSVPALVWLAHVHSIPMLILDFCLIQIWVNVATSPYQALIPDFVPKERQGMASAYMGISSLVGQLGGLLVCAVLLARPGGLIVITTLYSALIVLAMLYTLWRIREITGAVNPLPRLGVAETVVESFRVSPRQHPDFFRLIVSRFAINMGFYTAIEFLDYYVSGALRAPNPMATVTQILIVTTVAGLLGNLPGGLLSDRVSKKLVVSVSIAVTTAAVLIFLLTTSIPVALVAAAIFGFGFGAFTAVDWAFACNLLPGYDEAKHMGIWHVAFTVPQVVGPAIGGPLAYVFNTHYGHGLGYRVVMFAIIVYLIAGALLIRPIRERRLTPAA